MRSPLRVAALAAIPLLTGCFFKHAHIALGESRLPYQGHPLRPASEFRLGYALEKFPRWSGAFAASHSSPPFDSAAYIEPTCAWTSAELLAAKGTGCRPTIVNDWRGLEVQYRWNPTQPVHPLASVGLGRFSTGYFYPRTLGDLRSDSIEASTFLAVGGGGELNIARWLHISVVGGYQHPFRETIPNRTVSNSGFSIRSLVLVGTPYRGR